MGNVRTSRLTTGGLTYEGQALLETSELVFRGEHRVVVKFADMRSLDATAGRLTVNDDLVFDLGDDAANARAALDRLLSPNL